MLTTVKHPADVRIPVKKIRKKTNFSPNIAIRTVVISILLITGTTIFTIPKVLAGTVDIANETFADPSWSNGAGWHEGWYHEGAADIVKEGKPHSGSYHMRLRARDAWTDRPLNLSGHSNARLGLYVKVSSFEKNDYAELMIKSGEDDWKTLRRFTSTDSNNHYQYYEFDLGPYGLKSNFWIGFEAEMDGEKDYLYVDGIRVVTTDATPPPGEKTEPIFGVTIDDINNPNAIKSSLSSLARRPMTIMSNGE